MAALLARLCSPQEFAGRPLDYLHPPPRHPPAMAGGGVQRGSACCKPAYVQPVRCGGGKRVLFAIMLACDAACGAPDPPLLHKALARADTNNEHHHRPPQHKPSAASELIVLEFGGETREAYLYIPAGAIGADDVPMVFNCECVITTLLYVHKVSPWHA